ncbi:MAG: hypothetical protein ACXWQX_10315 [Bdellovibrio sp.]
MKLKCFNDDVLGAALDAIKKDLSLGFVADSALYSKKFLLNKNIASDWITRVPESIKLAKELTEKDHDQVCWKKLNEDYKYFEYKMTYGKVEQRWIVVSSRMARHKELSTAEKKLKKRKSCSGFSWLCRHLKFQLRNVTFMFVDGDELLMLIPSQMPGFLCENVQISSIHN